MILMGSDCASNVARVLQLQSFLMGHQTGDIIISNFVHQLRVGVINYSIAYLLAVAILKSAALLVQ